MKNPLLSYLTKRSCILSGAFGNLANLREHFLQHIRELMREIKFAVLVKHMNRQTTNQTGNAVTRVMIEPSALRADLNRLCNGIPVLHNLD